jgi:hypothetical protein
VTDAGGWEMFKLLICRAARVPRNEDEEKANQEDKKQLKDLAERFSFQLNEGDKETLARLLA